MVVYCKSDSTSDNSKLDTTATLTSDSGSPDKNDTTLSNVPKAILICRENSHPFQDRYLVPITPIKVGRCVARSRQATDNAIFDCKVLSRNHALLWYENGKFFLQDTRSSNGTFVNNQRLSKGSEESAPKEICSGDIVQFGVDVVENTRKVTHGCIVATLKLILPDGKEAKASSTTTVTVNSPEFNISSHELYQLNQYLQEALHREKTLQSKLITLEKEVTSSHEQNNSNWKAMIDEDRLLSRIETLENQLQVCSKNYTEDKLREELLKLQEERDTFQGTAKESLQKALQDKLESVRKVQDLESNLRNTEEECAHLKEIYDNTARELSLLADKYDESKKEVAELNKKLQETEDLIEELKNLALEEKAVLEASIEELNNKETILINKQESLQADNDFLKESLTSLQNRHKGFKGNKDSQDHQSQGIQVDIISKAYSDSNLKSLYIEGQDEIDKLKDQLRLSKEEEEISSIHAQELQVELRRLKVTLDGGVEPDNQKDLSKKEIAIKDYPKTNGEIKDDDLLKQEIETLKELLAETRQAKKNLEQEYTKLKENQSTYIDEIEKLELEKEDLNFKLKTKLEIIASLEERLHASVMELSDQKSLYNSLNTEYSFVAQSKLSSEEEISNLKKQLERAKVELSQAAVTKAKVQNEDDIKLLVALNSELSRFATPRNENQLVEAAPSNLPIEMQTLRKQLVETREQVVVLQENFFSCNEEKVGLQKNLDSLSEEYAGLALQSKTAFGCSVIPLVIMLIALLIAFHPSLSRLTMTQDNA